MNKAYKVIFNHARGTFVVVSEIAGSIQRGAVKAISAITMASQVVGTISPLVHLYKGAGIITVGASVFVAGEAWGANYAAGGGCATNDAAVVIGSKSVGSNASAVAIGYITTASNPYTTAIGSHANATEKAATALGYNSNATKENALAVGSYSKATGVNSIAIGAQAQGAHDNSVALGHGSVTSAVNTVSVGNSSNQRKITYVADGTDTYDAVNFGQLNATTTIATTANNTANTAKATADTAKTTADTAKTTADTAKTAADKAVNKTKYFAANSTGTAASAGGDDAIAIGETSKAAGARSIALGTNANASKNYSIALGFNAEAAENATALGRGAKAGYSNSVAIGANSQATAANTVSVGTSSNYRRIMYVGNGTLSNTSQDAVTGSQLYAARIASEGGGFKLSNETMNVEQNLGGAIKLEGDDNVKVLADADNKKLSFSLNDTVSVANVTATTVNATTLNAGGTVVNATGLTVGNTNIASGSIVLGTSSANTTYSSSGMTISGGPSITKNGFSAGNLKITNVADGTEDNDAVNIQQVRANVTALNQNISDANLEFAADSGTNVIRKNGQVLTVKGNATPSDLVDGNIGVVSDGTGTLSVRLSKKVNLGSDGSVTIGNTVVSGNNVTVGDGTSQTIINGTQVSTRDVAATTSVKVGTATNITDGSIVLGTYSDTGNTGIQLNSNGSAGFGKVRVNGSDGTIGGLTNTDWNVSNVTPNQAATEGQLQAVAQSSASAAAAAKTVVTVNGSTEGGSVTTGNLLLKKTTNTTDSHDVYDIKLNDSITLGSEGTAVTVDGTSGAITVGNTNIVSGSIVLGTGSANTTYNSTGVYISNGPNITRSGINANNTVIANVQNGTVSATSQEAVTGSQLYAARIASEGGGFKLSNETVNVEQNLGGAIKLEGDDNVKVLADADNKKLSFSLNNTVNVTTLNASGNVLDSSGLKVGNTSVRDNSVTVGDGTNQTIINGTQVSTRDVVAGTSVKVGDNTNITDGRAVIGTGTSNTTIDGANITAGTSVKVGTATNITDGSIVLGTGSANTTYNSTGVYISGGPNITQSGINANNTVITNVKNGTVSATSQEAVAGSQLYNKTMYFAANGTGAEATAANASGDEAVAIGSSASASESKDIAIGSGANASGERSMAIGYQAQASKYGSIAVGTGTEASGVDSLAMGRSAVSSNSSSVAVGHQAHASGENSTALGYNATASNKNGIALGYNAQAINEEAIALGSNAKVSDDFGMALGTNASVSGVGGTALGRNAVASGLNSVALGVNSEAKDEGTVSVGNSTYVRRIVNVATGTGDFDAVNVAQLRAAINGIDAVESPYYAWDSTGANATATGEDAIAAGVNATASNTSAFAIGTNAVASGGNSTAIGKNATASGEKSLAVGYGNSVSGNNSGAFGDPNTVSGDNSYALGNDNTISGNNAFAVGNNNKVIGSGNFVLGSNVTVAEGVSDAVVLGEGSEAVSGAVSVGKAGSLRKIVNVENAALTADSTEAVAGQQLHTTNIKVDALTTDLNTLNSTVDKGFILSDGTTAVQQELGSAINITGDSNINVTADPGNKKLTVSLGDNVTFGSTVLNNSGLAVGNTVIGDGSAKIGTTVINASGIDAGSKVIRNVSDGSEDNDAVNVGQLTSNVTALSTNITNLSTTVSSIGNTTKYLSVNSTSELVANASGPEAIALGSGTNASGDNGIAIGRSSSAAGDNSIAIGRDSSASQDDSIAIGRNAAASGTNSVALGSGSTATSENVVSVGSDTIKRRITNVADGADTYDAVNFGQLEATNLNVTNLSDKVDGGFILSDGSTEVKQDLGKAINITGDSNINVTADEGTKTLTVSLGDNVTFGSSVLNSSGLTVGDTSVTSGSIVLGTDGANTTYNSTGVYISGGPNVTNEGIDAGGKKITNIAAGDISSADSTEAVNGRQLYATNQNVTNLSNDLSNLTTDISNANLTFAGDSGSVTRKNGETLTVKGGYDSTATALTDKNLGVVADGDGQLTVKLVKDVNLTANGSIAIGNTSVRNNSITVGDTIITSDTVTTSTVTTGNTSMSSSGLITGTGDNRITVSGADGKITVGETAINGTMVSTKAVKSETVTASSVKADSFLASGTDGDAVFNSSGLTFTDSSADPVRTVKVTRSGISAGSQKITNVAPGDVSAGSTDAVTGGQLYETNQKIASHDSSLRRLAHRDAQLERKINRTGAHAAAIAALHPLEYDEEHRLTASAGVGQYHGASALAVGAFYRPTENLMFSVGASLNDSDSMVNAGVSYRFGTGSGNKTSPNNVHELRRRVSDLSQDNQSLSAELSSTSQRLASADREIASLKDEIAQIKKMLKGLKK